jgi:DNA-binding LacI/PurR family transcriptional regulator
MEGTEKVLDALLAEEPAVTGLIVQTEAVVDLLIRVLQQRGKSIPDDFSIVGVAWGEAVRHLVPPLTFVNFPSLEIGRAAIELLANKGPGTLLPAVFVEGATLGPARKT